MIGGDAIMKDVKQDSPARELIPQDEIPPELEGQTIESNVTPFDGDMLEITVKVAEHLEKYEKALNTIMNFIVRRTYEGDWISHDKKDTPLEERTVNMTGAAAERIARDLGIQESNRTQPVKEMADQEKWPGHYTYKCSADFTFR